MVNPRFGFGVPYSLDNLEALSEGYEKFKARPHHILTGHIGCPHCSQQQSSGERLVESILIELGFNFIPEWHQFINGHHRYYDFFIESEGMIIEYDGPQHYKPVDFGGKGAEYAQEQFAKTQQADKDKDEWATAHGLTMLRIPDTQSHDETREFLYNYFKKG